MKIKYKLLLPLLLLIFGGTARAFYIDNLATGSADNLHLEFDFEWPASRFDSGRLNGMWAGGTYTVTGAISVLATIPIDPRDPSGGYYMEMRPTFNVRTIWNDGYIPDVLGNSVVGTFGTYTDNPGPYRFLDYETPDLTVLAQLDTLVLHPDFSGHGSMTWDFSRNVPDTGSTLTLLGMALTMLAGVGRVIGIRA